MMQKTENNVWIMHVRAIPVVWEAEWEAQVAMVDAEEMMGALVGVGEARLLSA